MRGVEELNTIYTVGAKDRGRYYICMAEGNFTKTRGSETRSSVIKLYDVGVAMAA
jgi:hypothetical protein